MASKKSTEERDEFGNKMPAKKTGSKTMRTIRSSGVDKTTGSRAGSSLRARGVEKGSPRSVTATGAKTLRASGAEKMPARKVTTNAQSLRAAGARMKANKTAPRSARAAGAESKKATPRMSTLRSRGVEKGGIKGPGTTTPKLSKSSYPQSIRAAGAKKAATGSPSSFRAQRFGKGKVGASAPAGRSKTQSMRAAEYKKKNPGKY
jgi:hypothetical protein